MAKPRQSPQTNGIDMDVAGPYIERVENLEDEIESERDKYMAACKKIREDIKEVIAEGKDAGIPKKSLKATIQKRKLERKINKLAENLDEDEMTAFEQMVEGLGTLIDLPLGQAAVAASNVMDPEPVGDQPSTADTVA